MQFSFTMVQQRPVGQGLLIVEDSWSHSDTPHSVGLLWTSDQLVAETSTWQHTTLTTDRHPCSRWDSNPQSQQASGLRPTLRPRGHSDRHPTSILYEKPWAVFNISLTVSNGLTDMQRELRIEVTILYLIYCLSNILEVWLKPTRFTSVSFMR